MQKEQKVLIEQIEEVFNNKTKHWCDDVVHLLFDLNEDRDYTNDIVDDETIKEIVAHELNEYGVERVRYLIANYNYNPRDMYHRIDGYGNIECLDWDWLEAVFQDIKDNL